MKMKNRVVMLLGVCGLSWFSMAAVAAEATTTDVSNYNIFTSGSPNCYIHVKCSTNAACKETNMMTYPVNMNVDYPIGDIRAGMRQTNVETKTDLSQNATRIQTNLAFRKTVISVSIYLPYSLRVLPAQGEPWAPAPLAKILQTDRWACRMEPGSKSQWGEKIRRANGPTAC